MSFPITAKDISSSDCEIYQFDSLCLAQKKQYSKIYPYLSLHLY